VTNIINKQAGKDRQCTLPDRYGFKICEKLTHCAGVEEICGTMWLFLKSTHLVHPCTPHHGGTPLENFGSPWGVGYIRLTSTVLRLINGSADRSGYITNFCSMIELLHEFKKNFFKHGRIQEVGNVSAGNSENWQFAGLLCIIKNWKFSCVLHAHSQFLWRFARFDHANRGVRQPVQPHTFYARLLVFGKTSAASFCSCKLLARSDESVLLPVLTCSLIFLHLWTAVSWRLLCFPPIS